jgi:hypothetical protein
MKEPQAGTAGVRSDSSLQVGHGVFKFKASFNLEFNKILPVGKAVRSLEV